MALRRSCPTALEPSRDCPCFERTTGRSECPFVLSQIFGVHSYADFDLTLEELEPLSFADVKERIIADCEEIEELEAVEPAARARDLNELSDALYHQRTGLF